MLEKLQYNFLKYFIYLFLEKGERNSNVWLPLMRSLLGGLAHNPGMYPDWELNQRPFGSQASAQSTEPHQPGPKIKTVVKSV